MSNINACCMTTMYEKSCKKSFKDLSIYSVYYFSMFSYKWLLQVGKQDWLKFNKINIASILLFLCLYGGKSQDSSYNYYGEAGDLGFQNFW